MDDIERGDDGGNGSDGEDSFIAYVRRHGLDEDGDVADEWRAIDPIERDDANLTELDIKAYDYYLDGAFARLGAAIGRNTQLRALSFSDPDWEMSEEALRALFGGVASNLSIRKLAIRDCNLFDGGVLTALAPFLERNGCEHLEVLSCNLLPECLVALASALSAFDTLEEFFLSDCGIDDRVECDLMEALACHSNLRKLSLVDCFTGSDGCMALAAFLETPGSRLATLDLGYNRINDEGATILAAGLAKSKSITDLDLTKNRGISRKDGIASSKL
ncbi:hypothetical protein ACHAXT_008536 [Thalassiosira profunda]